MWRGAVPSLGVLGSGDLAFRQGLAAAAPPACVETSWIQSEGTVRWVSLATLALQPPLLRRDQFTRELLLYALAFFAVVAAWIALHLLRPQPIFPLDDPYITLHSAQVLHWGVDPNYPGVSPLFGATSLPFLALVYLLLFVLPPLQALNAACWLGVLAYVLGLVYLVRSSKLTVVRSAQVFVLGMSASFIPFHLLNGLETSWAMAGVIWSLSLANDGRLRTSALAAGFTAAIRPDLLPFAIFVTWAASTRQDLRRWISAVLPLLLCSLCWVAATGHLFPMTGLAKKNFVAEGALPAMAKLFIIAHPLMSFYMVSCGPLTLILLRAWKRPLGKAMAAAILVQLVSIFMQFPSALMWNHYRYLTVLVPALVWAAALPVQPRWLVASSTAYALVFLIVSIPLYRSECRFFDENLRTTAAWCNENLPANARILVHDAGYMSFATRFQLIDYVGLKTPDAISLNRRYAWPTAGIEQAAAVSALADDHRANYLIILSKYSQVTHLPQEMQHYGWTVEPLNTHGLYWVYRIRR